MLRYLHRIVNFIMVQSCVLCRLPCCHQDVDLLPMCTACQLLITARKQQEALDTETSDIRLWQKMKYLTAYSSPVKELIAQGKFDKKLKVLKALGQLFAIKIAEEGFDDEIVLIPVPLHHSRLYSRGFNQAYELALPISKSLDLSIDNHCIKRIAAAKTQHFLSRKERQENAKQLFEVVGVVPKKIAVIDDIYTTGATMRDICACLKDAGAETIEVWIIARTLKQSSGIINTSRDKTSS